MVARRIPSVQPSSAEENLLSDSWRQGLSVQQFNSKFEKILNYCNSGTGPTSCPQNADKLHFTWTLEGWIQGEDIWCGAMVRAVPYPSPGVAPAGLAKLADILLGPRLPILSSRKTNRQMDAIYKLGYSMLVVRPEELHDFYRRHYKNVHLIIGEASKDCMYNSACVYADLGQDSMSSVPVPPPNATHLNVPIWKFFNPEWWNNPTKPLGGPFTLSPEPYEIWPPGWNGGKDNFYLGYTVEPSCMKTPYVPHAERPRQAYIFGKYLGYFMLPEYTLFDEKGGIDASINDDFYVDFAQKENVTFLAGHFSLFKVPEGYKDPPRGIVQHERLSRPEFQKMVSNSRVMIGLGNPLLSPTPYEALCLGIPFINPVRRHDPNNKMTWEGQHPALIYGGLDEPYVYHVDHGDREGYKAALVKAISTPIERYIPPHMRSSAFLGRMKTLLETDWRPVAKKQMQIVGYRYHS
ncbi:hypothetical protein FRC04_002518 [Tulasnella sp. 424]|nr:hypothetical protein FRC04_002518 [Tulasnella sp. 424]KAG8966491.1 hypothetical protein FRC05_002631 [Tulasnella sp. 425]